MSDQDVRPAAPDGQSIETGGSACLDWYSVKQYSPIEPQQFVTLVRGPLERQDTATLARLVQQRWSHDQVLGLLDCPVDDVRKLAALTLGVVGDSRSITALSNCLRDHDPMVNQMAEHALWTIWFRCGNKPAQEALVRGSELVNHRQYQSALEEFGAATRLDPTYAEAFNQRSITHYLLEDYHASLEDAEMAVQLMPTHFGAWSGMGHCHAHLGDARRAVRCYRRALGINPYLHCIRQIVSEIETGRCSLHSDEITRQQPGLSH